MGAAKSKVGKVANAAAHQAKNPATTMKTTAQRPLARHVADAERSAAAAAATTTTTATAAATRAAASPQQTSTAQDRPAAVHQELMEMNQDLLKDFQKFEDFQKVVTLEEQEKMWKNTAYSHREYNPLEPVRMPTDRTSFSASGTAIVEEIPGKLTMRQMREVVRLHSQERDTWTVEKLSEEFLVDKTVIQHIVNHVGFAKVLPAKANEDFPIAVWYQ